MAKALERNLEGSKLTIKLRDLVPVAGLFTYENRRNTQTMDNASTEIKDMVISAYHTGWGFAVIAGIAYTYQSLFN